MSLFGTPLFDNAPPQTEDDVSQELVEELRQSLQNWFLDVAVWIRTANVGRISRKSDWFYIVLKMGNGGDNTPKRLGFMHAIKKTSPNTACVCFYDRANFTQIHFVKSEGGDFPISHDFTETVWASIEYNFTGHIFHGYEYEGVSEDEVEVMYPTQR